MKTGLPGYIGAFTPGTLLRFEIKEELQTSPISEFQDRSDTYIGNIVRDSLVEYLIPEEHTLTAFLADGDGRQRQRLLTFRRYFQTFKSLKRDEEWNFHERARQLADENYAHEYFFIFIFSKRNPYQDIIPEFMDEFLADLL